MPILLKYFFWALIIDAEVVMTIFDVVLLLDAVGFDEPIFVVVLVLDEVDVVNGLDVVNFQQFLMCKVWSEMSCAFSSMMIFDLM